MSPFEPPVDAAGSVVTREPQKKLRRFAWLGGVGLLALILFGRALGAGVIFVLLLLAAGAIALFFRDSVAAALGWHPPVIELERTPQHLGSTARVAYRRKARRPVDVSDCSVECRLYCEEKVTYTRGTDTVTDKKTIFEERTSSAGEGTADGFAADLSIHLTANAGGPTIALAHNEVHWFLEITVRGPRLPRDKHSFELFVAPVLDPTLRARVQDT